jgi:pimeloyl-ACP methyl ester carboxylesterase
MSLAGLEFGSISTIDVRGTRLELFEAGSGAPLLFLHGLDGLEGAADVLKDLAGSFTVYAPSHPGFGGSEQREGVNRVDDLGYFYLDMMDQLGLESPVMAGANFGAWVAAEILTKQPDRASSLTLVSPLGLKTADRREQYVADIFMLPRQELGQRMQVGEPGPLQNIMKLPEEKLRRAMRNDEAMSLYGWTPYMCNPKLADRLHRIACPVQILWGAKDAIATPAYHQAWAAALPQAEMAHIADAGFRLHADQPTALTTRIAALAGA